MIFEEIGNIVEIRKGSKHTFSKVPQESSIRVIQIDDLRDDNNIKFTDDTSGVVAEKSDILIAWDGANAGTIGFEKSGYLGSTIASLRVVDPQKYYYGYVGFFLKRNSSFLRSKTTGSTIPHIERNSLEKLKLPIVSLENQIRIANVLSKVENLIVQRKKTLTTLDILLKSIFYQIFGDPVKNTKKWTYSFLGDHINVIMAGSSYGGEEKENLDASELGVLKVSAVTQGTFNPKEFKAVRRSLIKGKLIHPRKGDFLFSRANTRELVGATCIVEEDYYDLFLPDKIWKIKFNEKRLNPYFVHFLLLDKNFKASLSNQATGSSGSMLNISMSKLKELDCPIPPINLQNNFAKTVNKINLLKLQYKKSLEEFENLFASLSQFSFNGKLNLNGVTINENELNKILASPIIQTIPFERIDQKKKELPSTTLNPKKRLINTKRSEKIAWDNVSAETIANWIKQKYTGYHFNNELLHRFLFEEHITNLNYFSSEELKKNPPLNSKDDLKKFLYNSLNGESPFIKITQHFYNAESSNFQMKLTESDLEFMEDFTLEEKSGIYFTIEES